MDSNKKEIPISGKESLAAWKKLSFSGLIILKKEFEKEKKSILYGLAIAENMEKVYILQGKVQLLNSFIAKIDFILKK